MDYGRVTKIINKNLAVVEFTTTNACDKCASKGSCHAFSTGDKTLQIQYDGILKIGDIVEIIFNPKFRIIASILIFLLPLMFTIGFYFIGKFIFNSDKLNMLTAFIGLAISFLILIIVGKFSNIFKGFHPIGKLMRRDNH